MTTKLCLNKLYPFLPLPGFIHHLGTDITGNPAFRLGGRPFYG